MHSEFSEEFYTESQSRISGFKKTYLIFLSVTLILVAGVLVFLWIKLDNYQQESQAADASQEAFSDEISGSLVESEKAAQQYFIDYVDSLSIDEWVYMYRASYPESLDSDGVITAFIQREILPSKSNKFRAADYTASSPKFIIVKGDSALASFTLSPNGDSWQITESSVLAKGDQSLTVTAAGNCEIRVNGITANVNSTSEESATLEELSEDLVNPVTLSTYTIDGLISPDSTVEVVGAVCTGDTFYYETDPTCIELQTKAESFIKAILKCYAQGKTNIDGNISSALAYVDSSSPAAKVIRETKSGLEWIPPDSSVSLDTVCSDVCILADNCRFVEVANTSGSVYRVFFLDRGDGYKIVLFSYVQ